MTDVRLLAYAPVRSELGLDQVLKIGGPSKPQTGLMVQFTHSHEPWTKPWSGSAGFGFKPTVGSKPNPTIPNMGFPNIIGQIAT